MPPAPHPKGHSPLEYGLIAGLVLLTSISAILLLGKTVNREMKGMISSPPTSNTQVNSITLATGISTSASALKKVTVSMSDGTVLHLNQYPANNASTIQLMGANGITTSLANTLEDIAKQMLAANKIDKEQASLLFQLANDGHRIAEVQGLLEKMASQSSNNTDFTSMHAVLNGQSYSAEDLHYMIGYWGDLSSLNTQNQIFDTTQTEGYTTDLVNTYTAAVNAGALQDPVVNQLVKSLTQQIAISSEVTQGAAYDVTFLGQPITLFTQNEQSGATNLNAANICQNGSGADHGIQCSSN